MHAHMCQGNSDNTHGRFQYSSLSREGLSSESPHCQASSKARPQCGSHKRLVSRMSSLKAWPL
eukprot:1158857-Pelagomonas_calceolata.AAC.4